MVFQTNLELALADIGFAQVQLAGAQLYIGPYKIEQLPNLAHRGKGSEIFRTIRNFLPGEKDAGERLFLDDDKGKRLVVFQINIEPRLMLFDQCILQKQGILLRIYDRKFNTTDPVYQLLSFPGRKGFGKI